MDNEEKMSVNDVRLISEYMRENSMRCHCGGEPVVYYVGWFTDTLGFCKDHEREAEEKYGSPQD